LQAEIRPEIREKALELTQGRYPLIFGRDRVVQKGDHLLVYSRLDMPDWQVGRNRRTAVIVEDQTWFISEKRVLGRDGVRYTLEPGTALVSQIPGRMIRYDADYVRLRDEAIREAAWCRSMGMMLILLKPLIGLLPSGIKRHIEDRYGVSSRGATILSIWVELLALLAAGVCAWPATYAMLLMSAEAGEMTVPAMPLLLTSACVASVVIPDMVIRYGSYLREDLSPYGLLEWAFVFFRKRLLRRD